MKLADERFRQQWQLVHALLDEQLEPLSEHVDSVPFFYNRGLMMTAPF